MKKTVWTRGGKFFGYIGGDLLFTYEGKCVGRLKGNELYGRSGEYIGEVTSSDRLFVDRNKVGSCGPEAPSGKGEPIAKLANFAGNAMYGSLEDFPEPDTF